MKCLIVKLGAMGDVLRTTPLLTRLHKLHPNSQITWMTSKSSEPILSGNPLIHELLTLNQTSLATRQSFDWALNADEDREACEILTQTNVKTKKGYIWKDGHYAPADRDAEYAYRLTKEDRLKFRENTQTYQQTLFSMAGVGVFAGEEMMLPYASKGTGEGVALNPEVGEKWPTKKWEYWPELAKALSNRYKISWHQTFPVFLDYVKWLDQHKVVVTSDSLGLHLAVALKKKVVAFFGPTSQVEVELYGQGVKLSVEKLFCAPCYKAICPYHHECMSQIPVDRVVSAIHAAYGEPRPEGGAWIAESCV